MSEEESAGQFLTRLGVDGDLWAKEFCKRFPVMHADAIGWFCNAIEAGISRGRADALKEVHAARFNNPDISDDLFRGILLRAKADGVQSAIDLLKKLRPEHSGLGVIIHQLNELCGKGES